MLGKLLHGRYQVVQVLSAGGFCQTYLAQDTHLPGSPTCFVKHLKPVSNHPDSLQTLRQLFTREAQALKTLDNHHQVPQLLAHFEDNLEFYLVQEFISGHPLSAELWPDRRWSESQVIRMLQEILGILEFVHSHGLIHRDIKPSNIIRRNLDNRLVLIDFGSVKQAWMQVVTAQGKTCATFAIGIPATIAIGTPGYMPTEQERGRPRLNSDIYALGMIGIQALTGLNPTQLLEDSDSGEIIWQHQTFVSSRLASVLNKMVRYHFQDRYQSATEVLQALQPLANLYLPTQQSASSPKVRGALAKVKSFTGSVSCQEQYSRLEEILKELVGPIAPTLLRQASVQASNPQAWVENLARYLPPHQQIELEKQSISLFCESTVQPQTQSSHAPRLKEQAICESFVHQCEQALADFIGPIATLLVQNALKSHPQISPPELGEILAAKISSRQKAFEFHQRLHKVIHELDNSESLQLTQDNNEKLKRLRANQIQAIDLRQLLITPIKKGGVYASRSTAFRQLFEQALKLLTGASG